MGSVISEHNDPEGLHSGHKVSQIGLVTETEEIISNSKKMYILTLLYLSWLFVSPCDETRNILRQK